MWYLADVCFFDELVISLPSIPFQSLFRLLLSDLWQSWHIGYQKLCLDVKMAEPAG